jgi:excisionase family DNA binding protein
VEDRLLYRVTEVAVFLSVSRSKVYELLASGDLRSVKIDRTRLVRGSDLRDSGAMCCGARRHLGAGQRVQPLKADAAELRAALVWAAGPDGSSLALRLIGCLWHFCELVGDVDEPGQIAESVITRLSDSRPGSLALRSVVPRPCASYEAARPRAVALHSRALQAFRDVGDQEGVAWSEVCLAVQAIEQGDPTKAREFAKTALAHYGASLRTQAAACVALGGIAVHDAEYDNAETWHRQSVDLARQAGDHWLLGLTLLNLADCRERSHDYANAEALLGDALTTSAGTSARILSTSCIETFAVIEQARGRPERPSNCWRQPRPTELTRLSRSAA